MKIEPLEADEQPRGWIRTFRYPVALVQIFRPCDWVDSNPFYPESEIFHEAFRERVQWIEESGLKCNIFYDQGYDWDLTEERPRHYRLHIEFRNREGADAYRHRWS